MPTSVKLAPKSKQRTAEYSGLPYWLTWLTLGTLLAHSWLILAHSGLTWLAWLTWLILGLLMAHLTHLAHMAHSWLTQLTWLT